MTPVKTLPRFRCAYCKRISTKASMETHELRCFKNPDRHCIYCDGALKRKYGFDDHINDDGKCTYCAAYWEFLKDVGKDLDQNNARSLKPEFLAAFERNYEAIRLRML